MLPPPRYELPESEALEAAAANNASALGGHGVLGLPDPRNLKGWTDSLVKFIGFESMYILTGFHKFIPGFATKLWTTTVQTILG